MTISTTSQPLSSGVGFGLPRTWQLGDKVFARLCQSAALFVIVAFVALVGVLVWQAWLAFDTIGLKFFTSSDWDPEETHRVFGALPFIYGTLTTSLIAMLIAVPLGVGTAAFLSEIAPPWLQRLGAFLVEMLAAIPSVVYGFFGYFAIAPVIQKIFTLLGGPNNGGFGIVAAGVLLAIMIVPYISAVSFDVCRAVPNSQREGAYALGATRWQTIWGVVLPYARPGIIGGCFLALGRALGETMAVTMLIGNRPVIEWSPFAVGHSIPSVIANELPAATYDLYQSALVLLGVVLLLVTISVNGCARLMIWRMNRPSGKPGLLSGMLSLIFKKPAETRPAVSKAVAKERVGDMPSNARWINSIMTYVLAACVAITVGLLVYIFSFLVFQGAGALNWEFFVNKPVPPGEPGGGMANALVGSGILVGLASLFAIPIGVLAAVFLSEYRSDYLAPAVRFFGELLTGVPSIMIGVFSYYVIVKPMGGFSGWAGSFALGLIMIPIVMRATEEALRLVPASLRHASYALGACHYQTVLRVTLPAALPAIITAVFLSIARVVGETAPLMLTAFNNNDYPSSLSDAMPSLPYFIYQYSKSPFDDWIRQAWAAALVLLLVVMILSLGVRLIMGRQAVATRQAG